LAASAQSQVVGGYFGPLLNEESGTWSGVLCAIHGIHLSGDKIGPQYPLEKKKPGAMNTCRAIP
jgi:hypothetical protein